MTPLRPSGLAGLLGLSLLLLGPIPTPAGAALPPGATAPAFTTEAALGGNPFTLNLAEALKKVAPRLLCGVNSGCSPSSP